MKKMLDIFVIILSLIAIFTILASGQVRIEERNGTIHLTNEPVKQKLNENLQREEIDDSKSFQTYIKQREQEIERQEFREKKRKEGPRLGMGKDYVLAIWGEPDRINETATKWGKDEQWVYETYKLYLYFEKDILKSYQQTK